MIPWRWRARTNNPCVCFVKLLFIFFSLWFWGTAAAIMRTGTARARSRIHANTARTAAGESGARSRTQVNHILRLCARAHAPTNTHRERDSV